MKIDAHVHFWQLARGDYGWMTADMTAILRDFGADDLSPLIEAAGVDRVVIVQAAPTVAETEFILAIAGATDFVAGVVGWVDMESPDAVAELERLSGQSALKAIRPMIHDIAEDDWVLGDGLTPVFGKLTELGLAFDCLVRPRHLGHLARLLARHPDLGAVICHGAKPDIAGGEFDGWAAGMRALAQDTGAYCKLSGLITEAGPGWSVDKLKPYSDHLLDCFGPDRLIWGSDWPVLTMTAPYAAWWRTVNELLSGLGEEDRAKIFGANAKTAYKL